MNGSRSVKGKHPVRRSHARVSYRQEKERPFVVGDSQSVSGHVGATCDHSSVCIATPSRSSPSRYLKMSSTVCPEVPKKLRDRPLLS